MERETHKCRLCSRTFANGRALGGHMKAHLASLPIPPPTRAERLGGPPLSSSSSSAGEESEEKAAVYELRENPKKSFRLADPGFSFAHDHIVVQDRESETESRNPTRKRSKRNRNRKLESNIPNSGKPRPNIESPPESQPDPPPEPEPEPVSSVSYTSPEEDVAMCLMMLSRDKWVKTQRQDQKQSIETRSFGEIEELGKIKMKKLIRRKKRCEKCMKQFRSYRALYSHEEICRQEEDSRFENGGNRRIFKCPFCFKLFGSGQALGGHKRSHLLSSTNTVNASDSLKLEISLIDLNLPAPVEEDDYSVVSDA